MGERLNSKNSNKIIIVFFFTFLLLFTVAFIPLITNAYASNSTYISEWDGQIVKAMGLIRTFGTVGCAVGVAWCGIQMAYGNEQDAEKAKKTALMLLCAIAAIQLLPRVIMAGKTIGRKYQWDPSSLGGG